MKYDINLFIQDKEVEFTSDPKILFNQKETELHNPTIVRNSFTKEIELDGTNINNQIFGDIWKLDRYQYYGTEGGASFNPIKKAPFKLFVNGDLYQRGYVKLNTVKRKNNTIKYSVTLFGGLGDFFYCLMYDQDSDSNRKKTLADLIYTTNDGEIHPVNGLDFYINKDAITDAWNQLTRKTGTIDGRWDVINFIPCYNGYPEDFDSNKVLVNLNGIPESTFERTQTVDGVEYTPVINGVSNLSGYTLAEASENLTEWECFDLRSYLQRPCISMYRVLQACFQPENNGGYQVKLDDHFFNVDNPYYYFSWMTLPMIKEVEQDAVATEQISSANLVKSSDYYYTVNYGGGTLSSINNVKMRLGVQFTPTTQSTASNLYTSRRVKSKNVITVSPNTYSKDYWYNCGVVLQLKAIGMDGRVCGKSKVYLLSSEKNYANAFVPVWKGFTGDDNLEWVTGYDDSKYEWINGYWHKNGNTYDFVDVNGRQTDIDFSFDADSDIDHIELHINCNWNYYCKFAVWGNQERFNMSGMPDSTVTLYKARTDTISGNHRLSEVIPMDAVEGQFNYVIKSFQGQASDYENLYSDTYITAEKLLGGDKTPAEYLIDYCKLFGLYFYQDSTEQSDNPDKYPSGVIHIMDRDTFYTDEFVNLNDAIDYSRDITITPAIAEAKWYQFDQEQAESQANNEYTSTYNNTYGKQLVNTNYNFDNNTINLYDGSVFKGGIMVWEKDKYFKQARAREGVPNYVFNGLKYSLYSMGEEGLESTEIDERIVNTNSWNNINDYDLPNYDVMPKLQFHTDDNSPSDGSGVLVTFVRGINTRVSYYVTDDVQDFVYLNENTPCWILTNNEYNVLGNKIANRIQTLPYFTRDLIRVGLTGNITNSWNFGHPQVTYCPNTYSTTNDSIYDKCWKNYIGDIYDVNSRKLTCCANINIDGKPWSYWFRRFYWFNNAIWRLNEIKDLNMASFEPTQLEFIKVQDVNNYKLEQIRWGGLDEIVFDESIVNCSAQTVTGKVISQSGDNWAFGDFITRTDTITSAYTYYTPNELQLQPLVGSGDTTPFSFVIPANSGNTVVEWKIDAENSDDVWFSGSFIQEPEGEFIGIVITPEEQTVSYSAHTAQFAYRAYNVSGISATTNVDWCTIALDEGNINLTFGDNSGASARTATITLAGYSTSGASELRTATATLTQEIVPPPAPLEIILTPSTQKVGQSTTAATITYSVQGGTLTNVGVSCDDDWATATLTGNTITVTMGENTGNNERTATIILTGTSNSQTARGVATVTQRGNSIDVWPESLEFDYFANRQGRVEITGGSEWTATIIDN